MARMVGPSQGKEGGEGEGQTKIRGPRRSCHPPRNKMAAARVPVGCGEGSWKGTLLTF